MIAGLPHLQNLRCKQARMGESLSVHTHMRIFCRELAPGHFWVGAYMKYWIRISSVSFALFLVACGGGGGGEGRNSPSIASGVSGSGSFVTGGAPIAGQASGVPSTGQNGGDDGGTFTPVGDKPASSTPPWSGDSGLPSGSVATMRAVNTGDSQLYDVPVTFGQVFIDGAVGQGDSLQAYVGGVQVPTQVDRKATYADHSLRHAVVTVLLPQLDSKATPVVTLKKGGSVSDTAVTVGGLLSTSFSATVALTINGQQYTADARKLLQSADAMGQCKPWSKICNVWLKGPLTSEWLVGGPIAADGSIGSHIAVYFYIRAYASAPGGAVNRARVNVVVENDWAYGANPQDITYSATIRVGDKSFEVDGLKHYFHARWHKVIWWGGKPSVYAQLNTAYLQATGAVSKYAAIKPTDDFLAGVIQSCAPMDHCDQTGHMGNAGSQPSIGPLPRWTTAYVLSMDERAYRWMLANDDGVGAYPFHYRDKQTDRPMTVIDHPYASIAYNTGSRFAPSAWQKDAFPVCSGCSDPDVFDIAHHPSIGYVPYMVTGDFYYLEELQFTASYIGFWSNPGYRAPKGSDYKYLLAQPQVRGQAWAMRTMGDAAFITPDNDPLKSYFKDIVSQNLNYYNAIYTDNADSNALHVVSNGGALAYQYPEQSGDYNGIAPWQDDFFTWAIGHLADQGFSGAFRFLQWKAKFQVSLMSPESGYCWLLAAAYRLRVTDASKDASGIYDSFAKLYDINYPTLTGTVCNSQEMRNRLGELDPKYAPIQPDQIIGLAHSTTGYPANLQPALAAAASYDLPGAHEAWQRFDNRAIKPDYRNYANFAVVPR